MRLGKLAPKDDPRTLRLANYIAPGLPAPAHQVDYGAKVPSWPMYSNDSVGDCTIAAAGHLIQAWTANSGSLVTPSEDVILAAYSAITGYRPGDSSTDNGAVEVDVLNYWRQTGIAGNRIAAYASVNPRRHQHVLQGVDLFGGLYVGLSLPLSAQDMDVWSFPGNLRGDNEPGSWGGHAVPVVGYGGAGLVCVTWGAVKLMTWGFWSAYCDEAYALLDSDWFDSNGKCPAGLDLEALQKDLKAVTG